MICLDPHVTQDSVNVGTKSCPDEEEADSTYHTELFYRWHMDQLDPSIALVSITKIKTFSQKKSHSILRAKRATFTF